MGKVTSIEKGRKPKAERGRWLFRGIGRWGEETFRGSVEHALSHKHLAMAKKFWKAPDSGTTRTVKLEVIHPDGLPMVFERDPVGCPVEAA